MKKALTVCFLCVCVIASGQDKPIRPVDGNSSELIAQGLKLYPIESGTIVYSVEDQPLDTVIFSFDRYGWRQITIEKGEKNYYGIKTKIHTQFIKDGTAVYNINLLDSKGITSQETEYADLAKYKNPNELLEAQMSRLSATIVGTEILLGKECEVWQYLSKGKLCRIWIWNSLILKDMGIKSTLTAIQLSTETPNQSFDLPDGIVWRLPTN